MPAQAPESFLQSLRYFMSLPKQGLGEFLEFKSSTTSGNNELEAEGNRAPWSLVINAEDRQRDGSVEELKKLGTL